MSNSKILMNNGKNSLLPPKIPFPTMPQSYKAFPKGKTDNSRHHRASSESFSMEEQPSWLDELLDEPETPLRRGGGGGGGGHRRSSSDSFAYVEAADTNYVARDDNKYKKFNPSWGFHDFDFIGNARAKTLKMDTNPYVQTKKGPHRSIPSPRLNEDAEEKQDQVEHDTKDSDEKKDSSEAETKRANQQLAQRSRVRKLQYIAELEKSVQALQADGSEIAAEIEFLSQQNLIMRIENRALRQRLEGLSQEHRIKYLEHEVLKREVQRMKSLYMQQRSNSEDLDQKFADLSLRHREANCDLNSVSGKLHM